jgi:hypothetical protein
MKRKVRKYYEMMKRWEKIILQNECETAEKKRKVLLICSIVIVTNMGIKMLRIMRSVDS